MSSCELLVKVMQRFSITYHFRSSDLNCFFFSYPNICLFKAPAKSLSCLVWQYDEMNFSSVFCLDLMILCLEFNFHSLNAPWLNREWGPEPVKVRRRFHSVFGMILLIFIWPKYAQSFIAVMPWDCLLPQSHDTGVFHRIIKTDEFSSCTAI